MKKILDFLKSATGNVARVGAFAWRNKLVRYSLLAALAMSLFSPAILPILAALAAAVVSVSVLGATKLRNLLPKNLNLFSGNEQQANSQQTAKTVPIGKSQQQTEHVALKTGDEMTDALVKRLTEAKMPVEIRWEKGLEVLNNLPDKYNHLKNNKDKVYGFAYNGVIYLNPQTAKADIPIHEYTHIWAEVLRQNNRQEWDNIVGIMKQETELWEDVKRNYPYLETDDEIADEVLATYSGRHGAELLRSEEFASKFPETTYGKLQVALEKFWKFVGKFFNVHYNSKEEIAERALHDMLSGVNPLKDAKGELKHAAAIRHDTEDARQLMLDFDFDEGKKKKGPRRITPKTVTKIAAWTLPPMAFTGFGKSGKEILDNLSKGANVSRLSMGDITRIVKEIGTERRDETSLSFQDAPGNNWNSTVHNIDVDKKGDLYLNFYVQYSNTDTNRYCEGSKFFTSGDYRGSIAYQDRYGNNQTDYYVYHEKDKNNVRQAVLQAYGQYHAIREQNKEMIEKAVNMALKYPNSGFNQNDILMLKDYCSKHGTKTDVLPILSDAMKSADIKENGRQMMMQDLGDIINGRPVGQTRMKDLEEKAFNRIYYFFSDRHAREFSKDSKAIIDRYLSAKPCEGYTLTAAERIDLMQKKMDDTRQRYDRDYCHGASSWSFVHDTMDSLRKEYAPKQEQSVGHHR